MMLRTLACALALAALAAPGAAETKKPTGPGAATQKASPVLKQAPGVPVIQNQTTTANPKAATVGKAKLQINPSVLRKLQPAEAEPEVDRVDAAYGEFKSAKTAMVGAKRRLRSQVRQCSERSYSAADQSAAGCESTDTVAECSEKLLRRCSAGSHVRYVRTRRALVQKAVALRNTVDNVTSIYVP